MQINLKTKDGELISKDMLDIDFDMSVKKEHSKSGKNFYVIWVNKRLKFNETFESRELAEIKMVEIAETRNALERSLLGWDD